MLAAQLNHWLQVLQCIICQTIHLRHQELILDGSVEVVLQVTEL